MFKWLNKQGVESDKGFIVQVTGRFSIDYIEGDKVISIYIEPTRLSPSKFGVVIHPEAFKNWDNGELIPKHKQNDILKNFTEAMEFQNIGVDFFRNS